MWALSLALQQSLSSSPATGWSQTLLSGGFPSSPIPVAAAANHLPALITVLTLHPPLAFGVRLWHRDPSWGQLPSPLTQRFPLSPCESVLLRAEGSGGLMAPPEGAGCPGDTVRCLRHGSTHAVLGSQGQAQPQHDESGVTSVLGWSWAGLDSLLGHGDSSFFPLSPILGEDGRDLGGAAPAG